MTDKPVTIAHIQEMKNRGEKISMVTGYDYPFARLLDQSGIDMILVGDSVGVVVAGYPNTLPVTVDEMIYHGRAVMRGSQRALVVIDMPFMSYQISIEDAKRQAGRIMQQTGAAAVKLEGGVSMAATIEALVSIGIPVLGHIGLTPQAVNQLGGFKVQREKERLLADARAVADAGAFGVVIECVPADIAAEITGAIDIPTIGIGAGPECDGQVLVLHDLLGLFDRFRPSFVKQYANLGPTITKALQQYHQEVKEGTFPSAEYSFK
ncbi:MAG: 3-methyl-2-oxobutanoate hydroxymethyltransferase [Deltaproteobacteria bacterium]|nr:3-methyl-2-oxobutanoate hydroxymethyltransferase [Candidatus Anaeroferrophillus wilburensis]MBN2890102.1 3-methyl-2-oxobutanoate hydroxymethyltransferase [Deltaproteobacteria bacterium]